MDNTGVSQSGSSQASLNQSASVSSGLNSPIPRLSSRALLLPLLDPMLP